ncbi:signal peptidase II [Candidatus Haliotispira prima]|uniref:Lipoprotein signal peptidase n=1 Tax=Candidatus Haliotispira prima TaxID=3034016 RepID=A0ABY8MHG7_9SPIO|nr:signal peptidase II [Candidatus Haliotispira prima]
MTRQDRPQAEILQIVKGAKNAKGSKSLKGINGAGKIKTAGGSGNLTGDTRLRRLVFLWTLGIIFVDQLSKYYIVANVPLNDFHNPYFSMWNGYLNIIHVRNPAIAFSIGSGLPTILKTILFKFLPLIVLLYITYIVAKDRYLHKTQRVCLAVIIGGGVGNMIDRFFRPLGVVDFVDTDFINIDIDWAIFRYSMYRWPTYNVADASVLVGMIILVVYTMFFISKQERAFLLDHVGQVRPESQKSQDQNAQKNARKK